jgi:hypothetical protein
MISAEAYRIICAAPGVLDTAGDVRSALEIVAGELGMFGTTLSCGAGPRDREKREREDTAVNAESQRSMCD